MLTAKKKAHGHFVAIYGKYQHVCPFYFKIRNTLSRFLFFVSYYPVLGSVSVFSATLNSYLLLRTSFVYVRIFGQFRESTG